ncbi:MAG TPA: flavodoxin domain-containing protein [Symbiobacteriaceae bacterium]|nr:flavodoxin domain-containing protein [Symbiobacteriaceae bacterium]
MTVLVGYASKYGSTREVAEAVAETLRQRGLAVDIRPLRDVRSLAEYGAVVLGAPLFMFRWHKDALGFLARHQKALCERPVALFALGPTHEPHDEKEWQDSRTQLGKELANFPWLQPVATEMFGGKYNPAALRFPISWLAGKAPATDLRDFTAVRTWASALPQKLQPVLR